MRAELPQGPKILSPSLHPTTKGIGQVLYSFTLLVSTGRVYSALGIFLVLPNALQVVLAVIMAVILQGTLSDQLPMGFSR